MIEVYTPDQRLTGKQAAQALAAAGKVQTTKERCAELVAKAKAEAAAIVAAAEEDAGASRRQATADADQVQAEAESWLAEQESALRQRLDAEMARELAGVATQLSDIVLAAFEKLVGDIGAAAMVRHAVLHILRSHPQIVASRLRVAACGAGALADLPVDVVEDAALGPGEAVLETSQGVVDLSRAAQMAALAAAVGEPGTLPDLQRGAA